MSHLIAHSIKENDWIIVKEEVSSQNPNVTSTLTLKTSDLTSNLLNELETIKSLHPLSSGEIIRKFQIKIIEEESKYILNLLKLNSKKQVIEIEDEGTITLNQEDTTLLTIQ